MTSLSSHEHTHHECKQNITHTKFYKFFLCAHTHHKWKAALVNWRQKGVVVREYSVSATNPTETEGIYACSTSMLERLIGKHLNNLHTLCLTIIPEELKSDATSEVYRKKEDQ